MDYKNLEIKGLEDAHKISMLIYLLNEGRSKKTDIYKNMPSNRDLAKKLDELQDMGLVNFDIRRFENNTTYVELTELGVFVSKQLQIVQNMMSGILPEEPPINCSSPSSTQNLAR